MPKYTILLSSGSIPWLSLSKAIKLSLNTGYDGIELVPFKHSLTQLQKARGEKFNNIKSIHQSWRLDVGQDKDYGIAFPQNIIFTLIRFFLFPNPRTSAKIIEKFVKRFRLPVVVHDISHDWTHGPSGKEFPHGIQYEIIGIKNSSEEIKKWLQNPKHSVVIDTRDDQSLSWAHHNGFEHWKKFWRWIGIENISAIQLTLIGTQGIKKIIRHEKSLAEEQFLWLHSKRWRGTITVEVNPISLFMTYPLKFKQNLQIIHSFVKHTLSGKPWS